MSTRVVNDVGLATGDGQLKIELTNVMAAGVAPRADGRGEAHLRVLTNSPVGPEVWNDVLVRVGEIHPNFSKRFEDKFESFFPELTELEEGETDYDGWGHEQWFVVAERKAYDK